MKRDKPRDPKNGTSCRSGPSRRRVLAGVVVAAAGRTASWPLILTPGKAKASERIVLATWGGRMAELKTDIFVKPFTAETGIDVTVVGAPDLAKLTAMVRTGNVEIDVADLAGGWIVPGERQGVWEPLDYSIIDTKGVAKGAVREQELGYYTVAGGICYSTERNGDPAKHPKTWPEFWDAKRFPGRRGLRTRVSETLELALMGDGVPAKDVYPCDVERGFRALDRIKPHVSNWISETPKTLTLVQTNECDFTYTYNGRVYAANQDGAPLGFSFRQNYVSFNWAAVIRNSRNKTAAMRFLGSTLKPERQAAWAKAMTFGAVVASALDLLPKQTRTLLPDAQNPENLVENFEWWADRFEELNTRFRLWQMT